MTIPSKLVKNSPFASRAIFPGYSVPCGEYRSDRCTSVEFLVAGGISRKTTRLSTLLLPGFQPLRVLRGARKLARERGEKRDEAEEEEKWGRRRRRRIRRGSFVRSAREDGRKGREERDRDREGEEVGGTGKRDGAEVGLRPSISRPVLRSFDREKLAIPRSSMRKFLFRILLIKIHSSR